MRLRPKLNHSCTIQHKGTIVTGEDDYGRPTYGNPDPIENVPCRFEKRMVKSYDENGENSNEEISVMLLPSSGIKDNSVVSNVKDAEGNIIWADPLSVDFISLGMGRRKVEFIIATLGEL